MPQYGHSVPRIAGGGGGGLGGKSGLWLWLTKWLDEDSGTSLAADPSAYRHGRVLRPPIQVALIIPLAIALAAGGCSSATPTAPRTAARTLAIVNGIELTAADIFDPLAEAAGAQVLRERVLDVLLAHELKTRGLSVTPADLEAEAAKVRDSLRAAGGLDAAQTEEVLERTRRERGLGDARYNAQLNRSAGLRKLVAPSIEITPEELDQAFAIAHGPATRLRVVLVASAERARLVADAVREAEASRRVDRIAQLARKESLDPTALRGGLIERASPMDPALPAGVRAAIETAAVGDVVGPLAVDRGSAVLLIEARLDVDGTTLDAVSEELTTRLRVARERDLMAQTADALVAGARVSILDRSLNWSWAGSRQSAR